MNYTEFRWFYAGTALLALVIGALIGVSASPVVGVTVPLLFALLSAGGALYVVLGKDEPPTPVATADDATAATPPAASPPTPLSPRQRRARAAFLGKQFIAFAAGILIGIWGGVWVKLHSEAVWGKRVTAESAITSLDYTDARDLAASMALDERLVFENVPLVERRKILTTLHAAVAKRRAADTLALSEDDSTAAVAVLKSLPPIPKTAEPKAEEKTAEDKKDFGPVALGPDTRTDQTT